MSSWNSLLWLTFVVYCHPRLLRASEFFKPHIHKKNIYIFCSHCTEKWEKVIIFALTPMWCNEPHDQYFTAGWTLQLSVLFITAASPARQSSSDRHTEQNAAYLNQRESDTKTAGKKGETVFPYAVFCSALSELHANPHPCKITTSIRSKVNKLNLCH